ncbi:hypothetical protein CTA2_701 [Colletotrichum tanaceti]|uniref:Uncharacterized protein n=1 Tax=Colletotrichum tanaceti TaxID=1306861 RepID=A0A4U6XQ46_9PEZI|nr:hypothetical protein CTA2_701 [Colletotrichum tanaceti]TKW57891.1 hypothetical protein CTA1_8385 [Colletotrichum tanaceti]
MQFSSNLYSSSSLNLAQEIFRRHRFRMSPQHTPAKLSLLAILATCNRIEYERGSTEYELRKGLHNNVIQCLQRLLGELDEALDQLLRIDPDRYDAPITFNCMERMVEQQRFLIRNQLEHVEREADGAAPTPPYNESSSPVHHQQLRQISPTPRSKPPACLQRTPVVSIPRSVIDGPTVQQIGLGIEEPQRPLSSEAQLGLEPRHPLPPFRKTTRPSPQTPQEHMEWVAPSGRRYRAWPTADADYSRPALKPVTYKMDRDRPSLRLPGDMSGAVHIRRQLDEQEETVENAKVHQWLNDIGPDPDAESDDVGPRGQKRHGEDDLVLPLGKKPKVLGLRGGKEDGRGALRTLFCNLNPFGKKVTSGSGDHAPRDHGLGNDGPTNEGTRNQSSTNNNHHSIASPDPEASPSVIVVENLCTNFCDGESDKMARRYCDWFGFLIPLTEETPGSITASSFMARRRQRKKLEKLKTALGHMSIRPFQRRQATHNRIALLRSRLNLHAETMRRLTDMNSTEESVILQTQRDMVECCDKLDRDSAELEELETKLMQQMALEEKIFLGGVVHGDYFLNWITKTRNRVHWELSFVDRVRQKPERIMVGKHTYYSV